MSNLMILVKTLLAMAAGIGFPFTMVHFFGIEQAFKGMPFLKYVGFFYIIMAFGALLFWSLTYKQKNSS